MSNPIITKPSDFSLSRYLLDECSNEEKERIEQWIQYSDETRRQFEIYKQLIILEEQTAPQSFFTSTSSQDSQSITHFAWSKCRFAIAMTSFSIVLCLLLISIPYFRNTENKIATLSSGTEQKDARGFRDSLAFLRRITDQNIRSVILPGSDLSGQSIALNYEFQSGKDFNKADRTGLVRE